MPTIVLNMKIRYYGLLLLLLVLSLSCATHTDGTSRIVEAIQAGDNKLLRREINRGEPPSGDKDNYNLPIYLAILRGNRSAISILIGAGVDPNYDWGSEGGTLLTNAAQLGHLHIVQLLVSLGADVNLTSGHSALYRAIINHHTDVVCFLRANGATLNERDEMALLRLMEAGVDLPAASEREGVRRKRLTSP